MHRIPDYSYRRLRPSLHWKGRHDMHGWGISALEGSGLLELVKGHVMSCSVMSCRVVAT